ncbi:hypothetical protein ABEB36_014883 [Hypothenemus hampei]|uniref:FLYWCH-type domain-containing protein n=1 Tax=Hypothenemus hampei TaxID=57062 RepID=A0ABD1E162_HYPHA
MYSVVNINFLILVLTTIYVENPKPGKHPKLIVDDNFFLRHRTQATKHGITIRWRCSNVFKTKCKAILYTTLQEDSVIKVLYNHNHDSNVASWDKDRMIPKEFAIERPAQACKRGPPKGPFRVKRSSIRSMSSTGEKDEEEELKVTEHQDEMALHIDGQAEPIFIKVINPEEGENEDGGEVTGNITELVP